MFIIAICFIPPVVILSIAMWLSYESDHKAHH